MKSLIKNYVDNLNIDMVKSFAIKNDISLSDEKLEYILNLVKSNLDDIFIDESKYLAHLKSLLDSDNYIKIENLVKIYKNKYKGYLF